MRKHDKRVFNKKDKLEKLIELRKEGWTYLSLAFIFGVDHSSIYYECKKYNVDNPTDTINFGPRTVLRIFSITAREKTYADYLRESGYKHLSQKILNRKTI